MADKPTTQLTTTLSTKEIVDDLHRQLEEAEDAWQQYAFTHQPSEICGECAGLGYIPSGSLGNAQCFQCYGKRVVASSEPDERRKLAEPDFKAIRAKLASGSFDALALGREIRGELDKAKKALRKPAGPELPAGDPPAEGLHKPTLGSLGAGDDVEVDDDDEY